MEKHHLWNHTTLGVGMGVGVGWGHHCHSFTNDVGDICTHLTESHLLVLLSGNENSYLRSSHCGSVVKNLT